MDSPDNVKPTLSQVASAIGVEPKKILFCYVFGSRLYGTAKVNSDWDIDAIVDGPVGCLKHTIECPDEGTYETLVVKDNWDINVLEKKYWQEKLEANSVCNALLSLSIPENCIVKKLSCPVELKLNYMKLKHQVDVFRGKHQEIAMKLFKKGNVEKAQKILVHPLRCANFAIQILEKGHVYDFAAANKYTFHIREQNYQTWRSVEDWYFETMYYLDVKFRSFVNSYKLTTPLNMDPPQATSHYKSETSTWEPPPEEKVNFWVVGKNDPPRVYFIDHLKKFGLNQNNTLDMQMAITCYPCPSANQKGGAVKFPELLQFDCDPEYSPRASTLADQSQGLVIAVKGDNPKVVCFPFQRFVPHDNAEEYLPKLNWKNTKYGEKVSGFGISLFCYESTWLTAVAPGKNVFTRQFIRNFKGQKDENQVHSAHSEINRLFWETWKRLGYELPKDENKTFMFVFVPRLYLSDTISNSTTTSTPESTTTTTTSTTTETPTETTSSPIYLKERLVLVGVRDLATLREEEYEAYAKQNKWDHVPLLPLTQLLDAHVADELAPQNKPEGKSEAEDEEQARIFAIIVKESNKLSLLDSEGFIVVDPESNAKITFKSENYKVMEEFKYHLALSNKIRNFIRFSTAMMGDSHDADRFMIMFPEWASWFRFVNSRIVKFGTTVDSLYIPVKHIAEQREFAKAVQKSTSDKAISTFVFSLKRANSNSTIEYLASERNANQGKLLKLIENQLFLDMINYAKLIQEK